MFFTDERGAHLLSIMLSEQSTYNGTSAVALYNYRNNSICIGALRERSLIMTDLKGGDYFSPMGHENWNTIESSNSGGVRHSNSSGLVRGIGITLIVIGVIGAAFFPPIGILIYIGLKMTN